MRVPPGWTQQGWDRWTKGAWEVLWIEGRGEWVAYGPRGRSGPARDSAREVMTALESQADKEWVERKEQEAQNDWIHLENTHL